MGFAGLESAVSEFIGQSFLHREERTTRLMILSQLPFRRQLDVLGALFSAKVPDKHLISQMRSLLKRLATAETMRNQIMHSRWALPDWEFPRKIIRYKPSIDRFGGLKHGFEEMSITDIRKIVQYFEDAKSDLWGLSQKVSELNEVHK